MLFTGLNVSASKLANLIKTVLLSNTTHTWLVHSTVWFKSIKQCSLRFHHYKNLSTEWKTFGFSEWINGPFSASCANFICFEHLELQQESEMHPYQRTKTSSSPKLYESMGILSGISQVGSSRPRNEPTGSSRSPEGKINRDQPTSRGIIPRPQFGGFFVFTQWLFPRHHNIIWAIRKPPFKTSKFSQHLTLYVLWPKENINQQSVSPQIKREPSSTVSPQVKRESAIC